MEDISEFALEYTARERVRMAALGIGSGLVLFIVGNVWISPWFKAFAAAPQCYTVLGYSGHDALLYSLFVGLPLTAFLASMTLFFEGRRILRDRQFPLRGTKVLRKTKILYGRQAAFRGVIFLALPGALAFFPVWGYFQAEEITGKINVKKLDYSVCASMKFAGHRSVE